VFVRTLLFAPLAMGRLMRFLDLRVTRISMWSLMPAPSNFASRLGTGLIVVIHVLGPLVPVRVALF
jgi:hypothetical protein